MYEPFKLLPGLTLLILLTACGRKNGQYLETQLTLPVYPDTTRIEVKSPPVKPLPPIAIQIAGLQKTGCYGQCPIFEYKIFNDGRVTYFGRQYVERMGIYEANLSPQLIGQITSYAELIGFFQMPELFPSNSKDIVDLPSTISFIKKDGRQKSVTNRYDAPKDLENFEVFFLNIMESLSWRKVR